MKYLLVSLAFIASSAMACPGYSGKDAMAPSAVDSKSVVAVKNATPVPAASIKKVAVKTSTEPRKPAAL